MKKYSAVKKMLLAAIVLFSCVFSVLFPQAVSAAPICYGVQFIGGQDSLARLEDCQSSELWSFTGMAQSQLGHGLRDGFCYAAEYMVIYEYPAASEECAAYAGEVQQSSSMPGKCHIFAGEVAAYEQRNFSLDSFVDFTGDRTCTAAQAQAVEEEFGQSPQAGVCYVFFTQESDTLKRMDCLRLFSYVIEASVAHQNDATQTPIPNATREEVDAACSNPAGQPISEDVAKECINANPITKWITWAINMLSVGAGVIIVLMIVIGGIQYSTAGANPQAVGAAKSRIINALLALVALIFLYSFLQWLVPGGIF